MLLKEDAPAVQWVFEWSGPGSTGGSDCPAYQKRTDWDCPGAGFVPMAAHGGNLRTDRIKTEQ
jgi:hypothetical protein